MKAIILAGGRATRLPVSAKEKPKALVEIKREAVLSWQIKHLLQHGIRDIRLSLGWMAERITEYLKTRYPWVDYVVEPEPLGTGGAIKFALRDHTEPVLVLNGDVLTDCDLSEFISQAQPNTMVVTEVANTKDYGLVELDGARIVGFKEKPGTEAPGLINAGIYYLDPEVLRSHPAESFSIEQDIFPCLVNEGRLHAHIHRGFWIDMGTEERLKNLLDNPPPFQA